ncbi:MAG: hypothetical protein ABIQ99_02260, partial [Thermoflexales bacterium]
MSTHRPQFAIALRFRRFRHLALKGPHATAQGNALITSGFLRKEAATATWRMIEIMTKQPETGRGSSYELYDRVS